MKDMLDLLIWKKTFVTAVSGTFKCAVGWC
jgi:hypothetical protein